MNWYKATGPGGTAMFGTGTWNLPTDDGPGEWMPRLDGQIIPCVRGYHVTDAAHVIEWFGPEMYLAEVDPGNDPILGRNGDKWVTPKARLVKKLPWDAETAFRFIGDCAQHAGGVVSTELTQTAQQVVRRALHSATWTEVDRFLTVCRHQGKNHPADINWDDEFELQRKRLRKERLWQNQRLLMYLHGGIA